jgi:hypothetical protein
MKKAILIVLALLVLVFWGEAVLEAALHGIEIVLEIMELLMDELLEGVLHLAPHDAQAVTAWLGFGVFALLLIWGLKKLARWWQRLRIATPDWWKEERMRLRTMRPALGWPLVLVVLLVLLILVYL